MSGFGSRLKSMQLVLANEWFLVDVLAYVFEIGVRDIPARSKG